MLECNIWIYRVHASGEGDKEWNEERKGKEFDTNVGPIPPLVTTKSYRSLIRLTASIISLSSSAITSTRFNETPIEKQNFEKKAELVSTV